MRIDFQDSGQTQHPVTPAQIEMRQARSRKWPVFRTLVLIAVIALVAWGAYRVSRTGNIYTYGLVAAESTPYFAPFEGRVRDFDLERGTFVDEGDVLFTLVPTPSETVRQAQDALLSEIDRLNGQADQLRENLVAQARKEVEGLQAAYSDEAARKQNAVDTARIEAQKLRRQYKDRQRKAEKVTELYALDAAVQSDVEAARLAAEIAHHNWQRAELDVKTAEKRNVTSAASLEKATLELERLTRENAEDATALERGRLKLAVAQTRPDDLNVESLFDGIVLEVGAMEDSRVETGRVVATVAAREDVWVEAYVPENKARYLKPGVQASIYLPGHEEPVRGTVVNESAQAIRVPELLRDNMPDAQTAVYVRINLELTDGLPLFPGGQVRIVIPTGEDNPLLSLFG